MPVHAFSAIFGVGSVIAFPACSQQLAFVPVELRREPALPRPLDDLQCLIQYGQAFFNLPRDLTCAGQAPSWSSSAFASLRPAVSKPSVNQPYMGASRSRASAQRP